MPSPLLVVTVAAPTMAELCARRDAVPGGADLVELRLDLVRDPDVQAALADRRTARPVILTCRARGEGGQFAGAESERKAILFEAVRHKAEGDYVDVEFSAAFKSELIAATGGRGIVLSSHDFDGVPGDLDARLREMRSTGAEVVKIAVMARALADTVRLGKLERAPNTVLIAMGPAGGPTRILPARFGSCWSYAGDGHAPGQISAARMLDEFRFREVQESWPIYGVVGKPVGHSMSPAIHNKAFQRFGCEAIYVPLEASSAGDFLAFADELNVQGASVTIPYKRDFFECVDDASRRMTSDVGALNTLKRSDRGWQGRNTDVGGFEWGLDHWRRATENAPPIDRVAVLGTGGAARAVVHALQSENASVVVHGRNLARAREVAAINPRASGASLDVPPGSWDMLVNTTSVGMSPNINETPFSGPFDGQVVYDVVYNPIETRLLRETAAAGCGTISGLEMFVGQAMHQWVWWVKPELSAGHRDWQVLYETMRHTALQKLLERADSRNPS